MEGMGLIFIPALVRRLLSRVRNVKNQVLKLNSFITVACYLC